MQPHGSISSSVRLHSTSAFDLSVRAASLSTMRTATPRRASSAAMVSPTGPAPMMRTGLSYANFGTPA